jgi:hypothetical protein
VSGYLKSPALEALITSTIVRDRVLGESKNQDIANVMTTIITGNNLSLSSDMRRRALVVELFLEQARAEDRQIKNPLDDAKIAKIRPKILSACWALVLSWNQKGRPNPKKMLQAFLGWSEIIGGILESADFASPCIIPELKNSGDKDFQDMKKMVERIKPDQKFPFKDLVEWVADYGLFENLIPAENDDEKTAAGKRKRFSDLLRKYNGRSFPEGQRFVIEGETQKTRRYLVVDRITA